jgi:galactose-1-phosphate uridylyltransferase
MNKVARFLKENRKQVIDGNVKKINAKEMGEVLRQLKARGVFKQGGRIDR